MMYIAGETQDVSVETLKVIEDIIRDQVVHMLKTANDLASRRGSRVFSNNDLIFQFRHDIARVERLRIFLTWKAIRKTVKDSDDKEGGLLDDADMEEGGGGGPAYDAPAAAAVKARFPTITLPWDVSSYFSEQVPETQEDMADVVSSEAALEKLRRNDERTRDMSVAEYATWSEYRHASLTYRKAKRFREWCGLGVVAENRPNDDVMDILGFLTSEMVQNLTAGALKVQMRELALVEGSGKETVENGHGGLFAEPEGVRRPVDVKHVRIAFQQLQGRPKKNRALLNGTKTPWSSELKLVGVVGCLLVKSLQQHHPAPNHSTLNMLSQSFKTIGLALLGLSTISTAASIPKTEVAVRDTRTELAERNGASRPFYAIAHRVIVTAGIDAALKHGANAIEMDFTAWWTGKNSPNWWADHDGTATSYGDMAEVMFKYLAAKRQGGANLIFVWLDIKNPNSCDPADKKWYKCSVHYLQDMARQYLLPAGIHVVYGTNSDSDINKGAYDKLVSRGALHAGEAIDIDGDADGVAALFRKYGDKNHTPVSQRVMSRGLFAWTLKPQTILDQLKKAKASNLYGRVFGWTAVNYDNDYDMIKSLITNKIDGLIYGGILMYQDGPMSKAPIDRIKKVISENHEVHLATANEYPW
ncbi:spt3 [Colletotrichum karsti]|uniref:Spt3 n=1 Tax=Colletotrichum karsti TaxID=1095194 RepID=A0A9P6IAX2_9PEZI|nr:spt3 [Colletotrichum karsti]KAF9880328.1 spt3 [Colletotrichum karsti]